MYNRKEFIKKYFNCVVPISVLYKDELLSCGTGTVCSNTGKVLTAYHVIEAIEDFKDEMEEISISVRIKGYGILKYVPILNGITLNSENSENILTFDISILKPKIKIQTNHFVTPELSDIKLDYGEDILIAGYSDEIPDIINMESLLHKNASEKERRHVNNFKLFLKPPTFKAGMLMHCSPIDIKGPTDFKTNWYFVDNGLHSGASGGPMIDEAGRMVGVITKRTITKAKIMVEHKLMDMDAPSGATLGQSTNLLRLCENLLK